VTSQHVVYYCTYKSVSLTCTMQHTVHVPCFLVFNHSITFTSLNFLSLTHNALLWVPTISIFGYTECTGRIRLLQSDNIRERFCYWILFSTSDMQPNKIIKECWSSSPAPQEAQEAVIEGFSKTKSYLNWPAYKLTREDLPTPSKN
jgi:hypothetical protein